MLSIVFLQSIPFTKLKLLEKLIKEDLELLNIEAKVKTNGSTDLYMIGSRCE